METAWDALPAASRESRQSLTAPTRRMLLGNSGTPYSRRPHMAAISSTAVDRDAFEILIHHQIAKRQVHYTPRRHEFGNTGLTRRREDAKDSGRKSRRDRRVNPKLWRRGVYHPESGGLNSRAMRTFSLGSADTEPLHTGCFCLYRHEDTGSLRAPGFSRPGSADVWQLLARCPRGRTARLLHPSENRSFAIRRTLAGCPWPGPTPTAPASHGG